jgi:hypothetical protein
MKRKVMKALIAASIASLGMLAGAANAADSSRSMYMDISVAAPNSATYQDMSTIAPRGATTARAWDPFSQIQDSAPRSDGVYGELEERAP